MVETPDPESSEDELVVVEEEEPEVAASSPPAVPAAPAKLETCVRPKGVVERRPPCPPPPQTPAFPLHDLVIDGDEQQWVYYATEIDGEKVDAIADAFDADANEVCESNVSRYPSLKPKSKLKVGTLLVFGACDSLLVCSTCRCDQREGDEIVICGNSCGRAYHRSCLKLAQVPDNDWQCCFCSCSAVPAAAEAAVAGDKRPRAAATRKFWKRRARPGAVWEEMHGDDALHGAGAEGAKAAKVEAKVAQAKGRGAGRDAVQGAGRGNVVAQPPCPKLGPNGAKVKAAKVVKLEANRQAAAAPRATAAVAQRAGGSVTHDISPKREMHEQAVKPETLRGKAAYVCAQLGLDPGATLPQQADAAAQMLGATVAGQPLMTQFDELLRIILG